MKDKSTKIIASSKFLKPKNPTTSEVPSSFKEQTNPNSETRKKPPQGPRPYAVRPCAICPQAIRFLLCHLNRRCLRHFSSSSTAPSASASATSIFSSSRRISSEIVHSSSTVAVVALVIDTLPLFTFSSVTRRSSSAAADCAVYLSKFRHQIWGWQWCGLVVGGTG
ncbi:hypothetical protein VIGAN_09143200 [Vigna angularis var. angularis]|uniref:Uncharacterized protein n=1 Tax=Vigna angularis var. angularis TaxID=157739 RepID=A0A0S3SYN4_PHAAN|nr:hypothetical protein VIGAN_09143200 [Vigna angularis var. angularis]